MSTITQARELLATALSAVPGYTVSPRPSKRPSVRPGDGWITMGQITPTDFAHCNVTLTATVAFGTDLFLAEERAEDDAMLLLEAVNSAPLYFHSIVMSPGIMTSEEGQGIYTFSIELQSEVDQ